MPKYFTNESPIFFCCRKNVVGTLIKWKHTPRSLGGWRSLIIKTRFFLSPSLRCLRLRQQRRLFPDLLRRLFLMGPSNCASVSSTKSQIRTSSMLRIIKTRLEFMIFESYLVKLAFSLFLVRRTSVYDAVINMVSSSPRFGFSWCGYTVNHPQNWQRLQYWSSFQDDGHRTESESKPKTLSLIK